MRSPSATPGSRTPSAPPASVLLVDDVPSNLYALEAVLQPLGLRLVQARSGAEALAHAAEDEFALVLMDVQMPILDGFETTRVLREKLTKNVPVIFVTAIHNDAEHLHRGYAVGGVDYLTKPIDPDVLKAKVRSFVDLYRRDQVIKQQALKLREAEMARAAAEETTRTKDEFLRLISHELRTPLTAITGWAEALESGRLDEERTRTAIASILRGARAQSAMVDDLVSFSEVAAGRLTIQSYSVDLAKLVFEAIDIVRPEAQRKHVQLDLHLCPTAPLRGDGRRLRQVALKRISNAVKFSDEGGVLHVELARDGSIYRLTVRDFGPGIPPEYLPNVFDAFRQATGGHSRPHSGLGIGLALAKRLVELHGGTIRVASPESTRGTTFTVELPAGDLPDAVSAEPSLPLAGVSLLLVDDEPDTLEMTAETLTMEGAEVATASSAAEALRLFAARRPDVVLSDLSMPGEDGFSLLAKLRRAAEGAEVPVIAVSAHSDQEVMRKAREAGFAAYVAKPFSPTDLCTVIVGLRRKAN